ncbi:unnamed protein product [Prorocentrum cordatum]|uniref:6-pyruvoyltetrahydropterin synthase n=1 Tax=Prorocentrum cordatum TaxID=2364126 RepID=A0ABN9PU37_9DINO|nr:unnamed protein product [Polarella glacialis]
MYSHTFRFGGKEPFTTGCTAVVQVRVHGRELGVDSVLLDISEAQRLLRGAMAAYDHKNLDELEEFQSPRRNTTVEVVAHAVFKRMYEGLKEHHDDLMSFDGVGLSAVTKMEVSVQESDVAFAGYFEENPQGLFST